MKMFAIYVIAACLFAQTFGIYKAEGEGVNIWFGNFGYHLEESSHE